MGRFLFLRRGRFRCFWEIDGTAATATQPSLIPTKETHKTTMPYPIWSHAADCVTDMIQRDIILTPAQELAIRSYVSRVPVRCVVDLLMTLSTNSLTMGEAILTTNARDLLDAFDRTTAHADHHMAIISRLRDILGQDPWFHERSSCYDYADRYFQYTRDTEEHVGFDPQYLSLLYTMLTEFSDDESGNDTDDTDSDGSDASTEITVIASPAAEGAGAMANNYEEEDSEDDDTASIQSGSTATTIPLENDLADLLENILDVSPICPT